MAVITFPTLIKPSKITRRPVNNVSIAESRFTWQPQRQVFDAQRFEIDLEYPPITDVAARSEFEVFLMLMGGAENTTLVPDYIRTSPEGVGTGTPLVNGASQTGSSIITDGWTAGQTDILKAGDPLQIGNYTYYVTANANSDGSGNATFNIYPNLRSSPANNDAITVNNVATLCRIVPNDMGWSSDHNKYTTGFTLIFVEELV